MVPRPRQALSCLCLYHTRCGALHLQHSHPPLHICLINTCSFSHCTRTYLYDAHVPWARTLRSSSFPAYALRAGISYGSSWCPNLLTWYLWDGRPFKDICWTPACEHTFIYKYTFLLPLIFLLSLVTLLLMLMKGWIRIFIMTFKKFLFSKVLIKTNLW